MVENVKPQSRTVYCVTDKQLSYKSSTWGCGWNTVIRSSHHPSPGATHWFPPHQMDPRWTVCGPPTGSRADGSDPAHFRRQGSIHCGTGPPEDQTFLFSWRVEVLHNRKLVYGKATVQEDYITCCDSHTRGFASHSCIWRVPLCLYCTQSASVLIALRSLCWSTILCHNNQAI